MCIYIYICIYRYTRSSNACICVGVQVFNRHLQWAPDVATALTPQPQPYRGTSPIRERPPPRTPIGPYA